MNHPKQRGCVVLCRIALIASAMLLGLAGCATDPRHVNERSYSESGIQGYESRYDGYPGYLAPSVGPGTTWHDPATARDRRIEERR